MSKIDRSQKYTKTRLNDWIIYCQICGKPCWASESKLLEKETGQGGLRVCMNDADAIDYGLVPYKIPAEKPIPYTTDNSNPPTISTRPPLDISTTDPMSISDPGDV